jgi:hypothetical protein
VRSSSGFLLLLVGAIALIGFLTGNLDRWLAYLFVPPGQTADVSLSSAVTGPASGDRRGTGNSGGSNLEGPLSKGSAA